MIISTVGGSNSSQLLEYIDYNSIITNPKIIIGYSDFTSVLTAITVKTDLVTYYGPALLPQFGEFEGINPYTLNYFKKNLCENISNFEVKPSKYWTEEFLAWDKEDTKPKKYNKNKGYKLLKTGIGEGIIVGGNMGTLLSLAGTSYFPDFNNKILFLEDDPDETPGTIDRYLTQFRHFKIFEKINGLVLGRFHTNVNFCKDYPLEKIILEATKGYQFPIILDVDFGHTEPMITIPLGNQAKIIAQNNNTKIFFK